MHILRLQCLFLLLYCGTYFGNIKLKTAIALINNIIIDLINIINFIIINIIN